MATKVDPEPDPPVETEPEESESLADTEGELQDFLGSDQSEDGGHLHLSQDEDE